MNMSCEKCGAPEVPSAINWPKWAILLIVPPCSLGDYEGHRLYRQDRKVKNFPV